MDNRRHCLTHLLHKSPRIPQQLRNLAPAGDCFSRVVSVLKGIRVTLRGARGNPAMHSATAVIRSRRHRHGGASCGLQHGILIAARLFARRRREFVSAPGRRKCHGDYFVEPQLGRAQPRPTEMGRDPTASERALGKVPQPAPQLYRIWGLFPLNSDC